MMAADYTHLEVIVGTAVTALMQEVLERHKFPNPNRAEYLTPAFAVAFFTGLGAAILTRALRKKQGEKPPTQPAR